MKMYLFYETQRVSVSLVTKQFFKPILEAELD